MGNEMPTIKGENKPKTFGGLVAQAKTSEDIWFDYQEYGREYDSKLTKDAQELKQFILKAEWVSLGAVQGIFFAERTPIKKLGELLKNRPDAFASPRKVDEWFEVFEREFRAFEEVFGVGSGEKKEGRKK